MRGAVLSIFSGSGVGSGCGGPGGWSDAVLLAVSSEAGKY